MHLDFFRNPPFTNSQNLAIIAWLTSRCTGGSMDRASDSGSEGWGFESLPVYQKRGDTIRYLLFFGATRRKGLEKLNATRMSVAGDGWTEPNLNFRLWRNCKRVPSGVPEKAEIVSQSQPFQLSLPFGQVKLPAAVKLLRSEGELCKCFRGKLNFTLCVSTKLHYAVSITSLGNAKLH